MLSPNQGTRAARGWQKRSMGLRDEPNQSSRVKKKEQGSTKNLTNDVIVIFTGQKETSSPSKKKTPQT